MDFKVGDIIRMKRPHPCGGLEWEIIRIGADFRLKCLNCGHGILVPRSLVERRFKEFVTPSGETE